MKGGIKIHNPTHLRSRYKYALYHREERLKFQNSSLVVRKFNQDAGLYHPIDLEG